MKRISGEMTVQQILALYPYLLEVFRAHGLRHLEAPGALDKLGPFLRLQTALSALSISQDLFVAQLEARITQEESVAAEGGAPDGPGHLAALLPCGLKTPFNRALDAFIESYNETHTSKIRCRVEGNVNHETSYYAQVDSMTSLDELPDIVVSSDINSFFHQGFRENFRGKALFRCLIAPSLHPDMERIQLADPSGDFTMISANLLVPVAINGLLRGRDLPRSWGDLLHESFTNSVVMRGDDSFFCNGVLLPFYRLFGMDGIRRLGRSVIRGLHPSEMVKLIDSRSDDVPPVYIMPYFFAMKIKERSRVTILIPREGALVSPVQMLLKRSARPEVMALGEYLAGPELGQICADAFFPSTRPEVVNATSAIPLYWLGWDFLNGTDVGALKDDIATTFRTAFESSGGQRCT